MVYLMLYIYIWCILLYFCRMKSQIYYKILVIIFLLPVIFIDLVDMLRLGGYLDIIRMYNEMSILNKFGWNGLEVYGEAPLSKFYLYTISLSNINRLLPIVNVLCVYFSILYVINKIGIKFNISNKIRCLAILYISMSIGYFSVTTNIRHPLAIALFFCVLIYDLIEKKNKIFCFIGYVITILIHPSMIILLLLRMLCNISLKYSLTLIVCLGFICINYWDNILFFMLNITDMDIISAIAIKQQQYTERAETGEGEIISVYWKIALLTINILGMIFSILLKNFLKIKLHAIFNKLLRINILISFMGFFITILTPESGGRIEAIVLYTIGIYIYIINKKDFFYLSEAKYNNLKKIIKGLFFLWIIHFLYFNIYLYIMYFIM